MSVRAMLWAIYDAPVHDLPSSAFRVLLTLADHADDKGWNAFPAATTIAERHSMSMSTVRRALAALRAAGVIYEGDQRLVSHIRGDRRPTVYNLDLSQRGVTDDTPCDVSSADTPSAHGVSKRASRGVTPGRHGVSSGDTQNHPEPEEPTRARGAADRLGPPPGGSLRALVAQVGKQL